MQRSGKPVPCQKSQRNATSSAADVASTAGSAFRKQVLPWLRSDAATRSCAAEADDEPGAAAVPDEPAEPMAKALLKPAQRYQLSRGRSAAATDAASTTSSSQHTALRSKGSQECRPEQGVTEDG